MFVLQTVLKTKTFNIFKNIENKKNIEKKKMKQKQKYFKYIILIYSLQENKTNYI